MASLVILNGPQKDDYYPLGHRTTVLGRSESLMVQILNERVSRKHLQIHYDKNTDAYYALDMQSRHGVYINGNKLSEEVRLTDGDHIWIGDTMLWFTVDDFPDGESALTHYKKVGQRFCSTSTDEAKTLFRPNME